tara:strand:+ start:604 stop:1101 length:498 start_codon:yes stop_codon:yes gene_type:complete
MKYIIGAILFLGIFIASILTIGFFLPEEHTASVSIQINAPQKEIWNKISTPTNFPNWRDNVTKVEILSDSSESLVWKEIYSNGESLSFKELSTQGSSLFVSEIIDDGLPFGGKWTITLKGNEDSTNITIVEKGKVYSSVYRFFSKFIFGHERTIKEYLGYLEEVS